MRYEYDLPQEGLSPAPMQRVDASVPENFAPKQLQTMGEATMKVADTAMRVQAMYAESEAMNDDNQLFGVLQKLETNYRQLEMKDAVDGRAGVLDSAQKAAEEIDKGIKDPVRRSFFQKLASQRIGSFVKRTDEHALTNMMKWNHRLREDRVVLAQNEALAQSPFYKSGGKSSVNFSNAISQVRSRAEEAAESMGLPKNSEPYKAVMMRAMGATHEAIINKLITEDRAQDAKGYFNENKGDIPADKRIELAARVRVATTATEADNLASKVWTAMGPKNSTDAVKIFDLEEAVRREAGDNENVQKAAIAGLRERYSSWNGQQSELKAQNIAGVWGQIDAGKSMKEIQLSEAWLGMSDTERHQVRKELEAEAATRAARAAANSQRALADIQRREHLAFYQNGDAYLTATDPTVLKSMSRAQVESLRGKFGMQATQQLLEKWDSIKNPAKYADAKMDSDDINAIAFSLHLDPSSKSKDMRNRVGALKYSIEQALILEQSRRGATMTRQDKREFIKQKAAETILIQRTLFGGNAKSIMTLLPSDLEKVSIPKEDRAKYTSAMAIRYRETGNPKYAPSEQNLKRLYISIKAPWAMEQIEEK